MRISARTLITTAILIMALIPAATSPQSADKTETLQKEIDYVQSEIVSAEAENEKYSGGLIQSLIALRIETLKQTRAMLEQKRSGLAQGIRVNYTIDGKRYAPPPDKTEQLERIRQEIAGNQSKIDAQKAEAARYSGGLVLAMKLSSVATAEQTQAMLHQWRVALEFDLPLYASTKVTESSGSSSDSEEPTQQEDDWEIVEIDAKVTESNSTWSKFAWKLTLRNKAARTQAFDMVIEFKDADGFVVDDSRERGLAMQANSEQTFTGYVLIDAEVAGNVAQVGAKGKKRQR